MIQIVWYFTLCCTAESLHAFFKAHSFLQWGNCHSFSRKSKHKLNVDNATDTHSVYSKSYHFVCGALLYSQQSWQIDKKCQQQPTSNYWAFRKIQNKWCCTKCRPIKKAWNRKRLTLALKIEVLEVHGVSVDCNTLLSKDPVTDWIVAKLRAWTEKKATELSVKIRGRARPKPASEE